jgi:TonB family protein
VKDIVKGVREMRDGVADVLAQRATLDRGAGAGIALSLLLHGGLTALAIYGALHASAPQAAQMVSIQFAPMPAAAPAVTKKPATPKPVAAPQIEEPKPKVEPKIAEPKPIAPTPPAKVEKNTVPLSPFGRSTKKGSDTPPVAKPAPAPPAVPAGGTTTADVPLGGSGVTGLEGGDFRDILYIQGMHRRIGSNWFRPQVAPGTMVIIHFRILRDGTIDEVKVEKSSGNGTFDRAALSAVRSSTPLNRLPFAYDGTYLGVHLTFR